MVCPHTHMRMPRGIGNNMDLNEAFAAHKADPSDVNTEQLGKELLKFCDAFVKKNYRAGCPDVVHLQEAVTETCITVWRDMATYNPTKSSFSSWVCFILKNDVMDLFRAYRSRMEVPLLDHDGATTSQFSRLEAKIELKQLIATLSAEDQVFIDRKSVV